MKDFEKVELLDKKEMDALKEKYDIAEVVEGSFDQKDEDLQAVEMDKDIEMTPEFPHNWCHEGGSAPFKMTLTCKRLLLIFKDSAAASHGTAEVYVDGKKVLDADPHVNGWTHCNAVILVNETESRKREVLIKMKDGDEDKKFTILGFGVC